ncbi:MAG: hypothetical protein N4J56_004615 [Chroococcidiopsis sp. SAG 2025]|nr:hypothetical protein [Chroococcidiopsis sp. SAG 2025]
MGVHETLLPHTFQTRGFLYSLEAIRREGFSFSEIEVEQLCSGAIQTGFKNAETYMV